MCTTGRHRVVVGLVVAVLTAGCAADAATTQILAEAPDPSETPSTAVAPDPSETPSTAVAESEATVLAGMYEWSPEGGFPNAVWSGQLVLDGPCVYLQVAQQNRSPIPASESLRSFVRLPEPLTRYNAETGGVRVGDDASVSNGDAVVLIGSEGWQTQWHQPGEDTTVFEHEWPAGANRSIPVCTAHVSFWVSAMRPLTSTSVQAEMDAIETSGLAGLLAWDPQMAGTDNLGYGTLTVDPPCLYVQPLGEDSRRFLRLPRAQVRLDTETDSIFVGTSGPLSTGDEVMYHDGSSRPMEPDQESYEDGCKAPRDQYSRSMEPSDGNYWGDIEPRETE